MGDEATLVERMGVQVQVFPGSDTNWKITTAADFALAEAWFGIALAYYTDWPVSFCIAILSALAYFGSIAAPQWRAHGDGKPAMPAAPLCATFQARRQSGAGIDRMGTAEAGQKCDDVG